MVFIFYSKGLKVGNLYEQNIKYNNLFKQRAIYQYQSRHLVLVAKCDNHTSVKSKALKP